MGQWAIRWYGGSCFTLDYHGWKCVVDPDTAVGRGLSLRAHEVLKSHTVSGIGGAAVIPMARPAGDLQIRGRRILTYCDDAQGALRGSNFAHVGRTEKTTILHLGALGHVPYEQKEQLMNPDLLFLPVGGNDVLTPEQAWETIHLLKPVMCVPMCFGIAGGSMYRPVGEFLAMAPEEWTIRHLRSPEFQLSESSDFQTPRILVPSLEKEF